MTAPADCVYDLDVPRRPGIGDVGDALLEDELPSPPTDGSMIYAAAGNQWQMLLVALAKVSPTLVVSIQIVAGVPTVHSFTAPGSLIEIGDISVVDEGVGVTRIEWAADMLPAPAARPELSINTDLSVTPVDRWSVATITNGVRVRTSLGAVATDVDFTFVYR